MLDAAKYADLVLLLVDGAFGFEMETFEFLNILQARAARVRRVLRTMASILHRRCQQASVSRRTIMLRRAAWRETLLLRACLHVPS